MLLKGIAAAAGLGIAQCLVIQPLMGIKTVLQTITSQQVGEEMRRLCETVEKASVQLANIQSRAQAANDETKAAVIGVQTFMLMDPVFLEGIQEKIEIQLFSAEHAVKDTMEEQAAILMALDDAYLRERAHDVRDIGCRLLGILMGVEERDLSILEQDVILVAHDITPSQMASLDATKVKGIVAEVGGKTSHTAILANNMEIPAVLGCQGILGVVRDGMMVAVDGTKGTVETEISEERQSQLSSEIARRKMIQLSLAELISQPTMTRDGISVELVANIMDPEGATRAMQVNADGIGLYRTEFLFMDRDSVPSEEEQYEAYAKVLKKMGSKPVIIRTMDIGGDKEIAYLNLAKEENPFLGYRAIRICLDDQQLFLTQLRAILRAGVHGKALVMYPMISSAEELKEANNILEEAKRSLLRDGLPFDATLQAGIMVEIPSAAVTADILIRDAAFFSIGSNDLTQYTLAVDRMNERISKLYNHFQPGVLRLIRNVIQVGNGAGGTKFTGMCGEMAADPLATLLLLGLGMKEFSVNPSSLLLIKKIITSVHMSYAQSVAEKAMAFSTAAEVSEYLREALPAELRAFL